MRPPWARRRSPSERVGLYDLGTAGEPKPANLIPAKERPARMPPDVDPLPNLAKRLEVEDTLAEFDREAAAALRLYRILRELDPPEQQRVYDWAVGRARAERPAALIAHALTEDAF